MFWKVLCAPGNEAIDLIHITLVEGRFRSYHLFIGGKSTIACKQTVPG